MMSDQSESEQNPDEEQPGQEQPSHQKESEIFYPETKAYKGEGPDSVYTEGSRSHDFESNLW